MEQQRPVTDGHASIAAAAIVGYWLVDGYLIGLPAAALAAAWNPLIVFATAFALTTTVNLAACRWINSAWSAWASGSSGARMERQLAKVRPTRTGRAAARWISSDSRTRFATAAALTCAIVAVTMGRSIGGRPLGADRIVLASVSYGLVVAGLFTLVGVVAGGALSVL